MNTPFQLDPPPQTFVSPLLELRDYYARLVEEYENLYTQARSQLNHVEALLSHWSANSEANGELLTLEVASETPVPLQENLLLSLPDSISESDIDLLESVSSDLEDSGNLEIDTSAATVQDTNESLESRISLENIENSIRGVDFPMLPQYQPLTRIEAIKLVLQDHVGTVCHIDFIVRSLYGELEPPIFKVVKGRVQSSLTQGREKKAWFGIPDEPGCYTLDLSLVSSNRTKTYSQAGKNKKPIILPRTKIVPMLRVFEGQFLIDAMTSLLRQNPGKVFSVAEVISGLYGELDSEELQEVKTKVLNELSRGHRTGRFTRVPDKLGLYTWDSKLMLKSS